MIRYYAGVGARATPPDVCSRMTKIATQLRSDGWVLRSGGAPGADAAWEAGAGIRAEIFRPEDCTRDAFALAASFHPAWSTLSHRTRLKHGRNCMIILGEDLRTPVERVLFWTPGGSICGGTGMALRLALANNILTTWIEPEKPQFSLRLEPRRA